MAKFIATMPSRWGEDGYVGVFSDAMSKLPCRTYVGGQNDSTLYGVEFLETSANLRPLALAREQVVVLTTATREQLMGIGFLDVREAA